MCCGHKVNEMHVYREILNMGQGDSGERYEENWAFVIFYRYLNWYSNWKKIDIFYVLTPILFLKIKDMLKARIVQILFSQISKNDVRYTVETILTIANQIESIVWMKLLCICIMF
jgi:hypothetical protein